MTIRSALVVLLASLGTSAVAQPTYGPKPNPYEDAPSAHALTNPFDARYPAPKPRAAVAPETVTFASRPNPYLPTTNPFDAVRPRRAYVGGSPVDDTDGDLGDTRANPYDTPIGPALPPGGPAAPAPKQTPKTGQSDPYAPKASAPSDPYGPAAPTTGPAAPTTPTTPTTPAKGTPAPKAPAPTTPAKTGPAGPATPTAAPTGPTPPKAPADPYAQPKRDGDITAVPQRVALSDIQSVQGLLAVQRLDGWLLFDRDNANPIAVRLVAPTGHPTRAWFYIIPAKGEPVTLMHDSEKSSFDHLPGKKLTYQGYRDYDKALRELLKGVKTLAVEYSQKAAVPTVSRVDAGTMDVIRGMGVTVRSSDTLVQYTRALWGDAGRLAHYVAAHHLTELRKDALAFVAKQLSSNTPITEYDVQQRIAKGMTMRGLTGSPPVVATGANTADPYYVPSATKSAPIKRGDLVLISLAARVDKPEGVYAVHTWAAVADSAVPDPVKRAFATAANARDQAISLVAERNRKGRPITGAEVDASTRSFLKKAGVGDKVMHRTGHSIDNDLQGAGTDLDDFEVHDQRILTAGTGFTIGPGLYFAGQFGVRTEVSVYFAPGGPEVTTPAQDEIEVLLH